MRPELVLADTPEEFVREAARILAAQVQRAVEARGVCRLAVSGGATPGPVYEHLGAHFLGTRIDPARLEVFFADERLVPHDSPDSHYRLVWDTLLRRGAHRPGALHAVSVDASTPQAAADAYGAIFPDRLDVLVLGLGLDGHTASLFPGSPLLGERERRVAAVRGGTPDVWRVTVTPRVIGEARSTVVLVSGREKAPAAARALCGPFDPRAVPVQLAHEALWVLDRAAARLVGG